MQQILSVAVRQPECKGQQSKMRKEDLDQACMTCVCSVNTVLQTNEPLQTILMTIITGMDFLQLPYHYKGEDD